MKLFTDSTSSAVFAFESDGSQDQFIKPGMVPITSQQADAIRAALKQSVRVAPSAIDVRRSILTPTETLALATLALSNAQVGVWLSDLNALRVVKADDPAIVGLTALPTFTESRANAIKAAITAGVVSG